MVTTRSLWGSLLLLPLFLVAACGAPEGEDAMGDMEEAEAAAEEMAEETPAMPEATSIALETLNESGITGTATATHEGASVVIDVQVEGATADGTLPAHIHEGDCATGGGVLVPLNSVEVTDGTGSSSTTLEAAQVPADQAAYVQVHAADGQPVACGNLQGHGSGM